MYGYVGKNYTAGFDTWTVFSESLKETDLLLHNPGKFLTNIFHNPYDSITQYWNYFQMNVFYKIVGIWNLFSGRNYYVNVLFFTFFTMYGYAFFIRIYRLYRPDASNLIILSWVLLPGFLFWGSGMYKEGLIFSGISATVYGAVKIFEERRYILVALVGIMTLGLIRAYTLMLLVPFLAALVALTAASRKASSWKTPAFLVGVPILIFAFAEIAGIYHIPASVSATRDAFLQLRGNSLLNPEPIAPVWTDVLKRVPEALSYGILRPSPPEALKSIFYLAEALQTIIVLTILAIWIIRRGWKQPISQPALMLAVFALFSLVVIGLTVPFLGAIVRYKSIYLPFLVTPLLLAIVPEKIRTK